MCCLLRVAFLSGVDRVCRASQRRESPNRARLNTSHVCQRNPLSSFIQCISQDGIFSRMAQEMQLPLGRFRLAKNIVGMFGVFFKSTLE